MPRGCPDSAHMTARHPLCRSDRESPADVSQDAIDVCLCSGYLPVQQWQFLRK